MDRDWQLIPTCGATAGVELRENQSRLAVKVTDTHHRSFDLIYYWNKYDSWLVLSRITLTLFLFVSKIQIALLNYDKLIAISGKHRLPLSKVANFNRYRR